MTLAVTLTLVVAVPASAWTQIYNAYPSDPLSCGDPGGYCIEWPTTSGGLSVNVDVFLYSSLGLANVDLRSDVRRTFSYWNGIAARNPHLQETTSLSASEVDVWLGTTQYPDAWAETTISPPPGNGHTMTYATMVFSNLVTWNRTYTYGAYVADARKVAMHEMGHVEALGHTGISPAVMRQGALSYSVPQPNDVTGIIAIYGAYP
jgi:hypothetical protein